MLNGRTLRLVEVIVIIVCVVVLAFVLFMVALPKPGRPADMSRKDRCMNNLIVLAKSMQLYMYKYGGQSMFAIPARSFRGDAWLATLYWTDIIRESRVFLCPCADDFGVLPTRSPPDLALAGSVPSDAISYAGLCRGLTGSLAHRNTRVFTEAAISTSCMMACDDNEGKPNHPDGISVVYVDGHAEFRRGTKAETYDLIGAKGGSYEYLDSGE